MSKRMKALASRMTIGNAVIKKMVLRALRFSRGGPRPWLARLAVEQLAPTPAEAWSYLAETSACIGCGLCEAVVADGEPSGWMAAARQPSDAPLAAEAARRLRVVAADVARVCPARVKPESIARLIEENARALAAVAGDGAAGG
jgi:hypothetical protein